MPDECPAAAFEDRPAYQQARELANAVYALTRRQPFSHDSEWVALARREALSAISHVAKGMDGHSDPARARAFAVAQGSCSAMIAQLQIARDQDCLNAEEFERMRDAARRLFIVLADLIGQVMQSSPPGRKHPRSSQSSLAAEEQRLSDLRDAALQTAQKKRKA